MAQETVEELRRETQRVVVQNSAPTRASMLKIDDLRIIRFEMTRLDRGWRTASYASSTVEGFVVELIADGLIGIGATAAHPSSISAAEINAQLAGPIRDVFVGADALSGTMKNVKWVNSWQFEEIRSRGR